MRTTSFATVGVRPGLFRELTELLEKIDYQHLISGDRLHFDGLAFVQDDPSETGIEDAHVMRVGEGKVVFLPCITGGYPTLMLRTASEEELGPAGTMLQRIPAGAVCIQFMNPSAFNNVVSEIDRTTRLAMQGAGFVEDAIIETLGQGIPLAPEFSRDQLLERTAKLIANENIRPNARANVDMFAEYLIKAFKELANETTSQEPAP